MLKNIVGYLEKTEKEYGNKLAYADENKQVTFSELKEDALKIATGISDYSNIGTPVLVYMEKSVDVIESFLGVAYTGGFYVPIDINMPAQRVKLIMETLSAQVVITRKCDNIPEETLEGLKVFYIEDLLNESVNYDLIDERQKRVIDTDPAYALFTSGSTGVPKGVLISQKSLINLVEWLCETLKFSSEEVFANQAPFYFDGSIKDIYATLKCGATMYIVPRKLFSLPKRLIQYLNDNKITCIQWVPSVLCMIVNFRTFKSIKPQYLNKVIFFGEVMPIKQLNMWRKEFPNITYINLYGPTEATVDSAYYIVDRDFSDEESLPIGYPCNNTQILLLDENDQLVAENDVIGEICIRGCSLALGYYNDPEKTEEVFTRNPLQKNYYERIYRTGDLGQYNEYGEILFIGRKDSQIKHMGHRIELGEIETAISAIDEVRRICCLFENKTQRIIAVYEGSIDKATVGDIIKAKLPHYMIPNAYYQLDEMPINLNGKIDRVLLKKQYVKE